METVQSVEVAGRPTPKPVAKCNHAYSRQMLPRGQVRRCLHCNEPDSGLTQKDYPVGVPMDEGVDLEL